jgi:hypothetical protein
MTRAPHRLWLPVCEADLRHRLTPLATPEERA